MGDEQQGRHDRSAGMTMHVSVAHADASSELDDLVVSAARCWRAARDRSEPAQQALHALLAPACGELAPVFDSLLALYEVVQGRPISIGQTATERTNDERLLIDLLAGRHPLQTGREPTEWARLALDCAVRSTRIMMAENTDLAAATCCASVGPTFDLDTRPD